MKTFSQTVYESGIKPIFNDIMKDIENKYGPVNFKNSMGSLLVQKDGVTIGLINRKRIDQWEDNIKMNLKRIANSSKGSKEHKITKIDWEKQGSKDPKYKHGATWTGD